MGLYLCVFDDAEEELEGVEVGTYSDFGRFRDTITERLEQGDPGSRFPTLILHSDCDGSWSGAEIPALRSELLTIQAELRKLAAVELPEGWQRGIARQFGLRPQNLEACFFDVDGEPLIERLLQLCDVASESGHDILFQ